MSVNLTINGAAYPYPETSDTDWGDDATQAIQALAQYALYTGDYDTDGTLAADSDTKIATQKATKTYADTKVAKSTYNAHTILAATTDDTPAALTVDANTIVGRAAGNIDALTKGEVDLIINSTSTKTADYVITDTDGINHLYVTTGATPNVTVTLPTASANSGRIIEIVKADSGAAYVIVEGEDAETINGVETIVVELQYCGLRLQCTGTEWIVIGSIGQCEIQTIGSAIELVYSKIYTGTLDGTSPDTITHNISDYSKIINCDGSILRPAASLYYAVDSGAFAAGAAYAFYSEISSTTISLTYGSAFTDASTYTIKIKYYI